MSTGTVRCPKCSAALRVSGSMAPGRSIQCPKCAAAFQPALDGDAATEPAASNSFETQRKKGAGVGKVLLVVGLALAAVFLFACVGIAGMAVLWLRTSKPAPTPIAPAPPDLELAIPNPPDEGDEPDTPKKKRGLPPPAGPVAEIPPLPALADRPILVLDPGGHSASVRRVFLTPDNERVVSVGYDKTIRIWDVQTGESLNVLHLPIGPAGEGQIHAAALAQDGKRLAVGGWPFGAGKYGVLIHLVNLESGQVERVFTGHGGTVHGLAFSRDGKYLASCAADQTARVYDMNSGDTVFDVKIEAGAHRAVAFSPDSKQVGIVAGNGTAYLWSIDPKGEPIALKDTASGNCIAISHDGATVATGSVDGQVRLYGKDGAFKKAINMSPDNVANQVISLDFSPNDKELLFTGVHRKGTAGIVDIAAGTRRLDFPQYNNSVIHGSFSRDGSLAVSVGGDDHEGYIWKTSDGGIVQKLQGSGRSVWGLGWSADGKTLAWGNTNGPTPAAQTKLESTFKLDTFDVGPPVAGAFDRAVFNRDGITLSQVDFYKVAIRHAGQPQLVYESARKGDRIYSFTLLPNDRAIIGSSFGLYLLDTKTAKVVREFVGHSGITLAVTPSPDGKHFVSGGTDETICFWSPDRDEPLFSLFIAGRDWIAWAPEGYYAASAYGERLMGWQVNQGPSKMAHFYPAVQFRASLFQPEVIKNLLVAGNLKDAVALAMKEKKQAIASVNLTQVLPPLAAITAPGTGFVRMDKDKMEVTATAQSVGPHPVTSLRLIVNGRPYLGEQGIRKIDAPRLGQVDAAWTVELPPGKHTLRVQAESAVSKGLSEPLDVVRAGKPELPNLFIFAAGVSAYPGRMRLRYAATDAEALTKSFQNRSKGVFKNVEVKLILDRDATRANILTGLNWLHSKMTPRDVGLFFFSGHGATDDDDEFYLVPVNVNPNQFERSCVSGENLKRKLGNMPGRIVVMLDCCHSGAVADKMTGGRADNLARDLVTDDYGVVVMSSSLGSEYSLESSEVKAGFFTTGLVEGMAGKADANKDRIIHIHELDVYAGKRVRELSRGTQHPTTGRPPTVRSFPLSKF